MRIITISDVVAGYGSPQIVDFTHSLCEALGMQGLLCQPLVPEREVLPIDSHWLQLETIHTVEHPISSPGRMEYLTKCARIVNRFQPQVLIITNYSLLGIIKELRYRPKKIIHLVLEDVEPLRAGRAGVAHMALINHVVRSELIDLWVFPEAKRAEGDASLFGIEWKKISIFYNVSTQHVIEDKERRRLSRIIYAGTLDANVSIGKYIFDEEIAEYPIDIYGDLQGAGLSKQEMRRKIENLKTLRPQQCKQKWFGQVPAKTLARVIRAYDFSIVYWLPIRKGLLNAAPNKFFQALSAGVPVISAPHPQVKKLIDRYGCGILLEGWEKDHIVSSLRRAQELIETTAHREMCDNCHLAVEAELSWERQMGKWLKRFDVENW